MDIVKELNTLSEDELTELDTRLKIKPDMRIHLSKYPIYKLEQRQYIQKHHDKPDGFWYGFGDKWIDWAECAGSEYMGKYVYEVDINGSNTLQIKNYSEIIEFTKEYKSIEQIIPGIIFFIDWPRMEHIYDGIEINPYIGQARTKEKTIWYYSWDVPSGCIWNLDKVKIRLVGLLKDDIISV